MSFDDACVDSQQQLVCVVRHLLGLLSELLTLHLRELQLQMLNAAHLRDHELAQCRSAHLL